MEKVRQFIECPGCRVPITATVKENSKQLLGVEKIRDKVVYWDHKDCSSGMSMWTEDTNALKALSIKQPWAWLIVNGFKDIENRDTLNKFRGKVLIHASKSFDRSSLDWFSGKLHNNPPIQKAFDELPCSVNGFDYGGIVGYCTITDCVQESNNPWFIGKNGFILKDAHPLEFIPCKGTLGFFVPKINE